MHEAVPCGQPRKPELRVRVCRMNCVVCRLQCVVLTSRGVRGPAEPPAGADQGVGSRLTSWKVDIRLPGEGNPNTNGARPVHHIISMMKCIRTSRLSIKNSLSRGRPRGACGVPQSPPEGSPLGHARQLSPQSHEGKGANGSKNQPRNTYPVQCRVPG